MLHNFLLIAFRNITKHKVFTGITVFGLALGMAAFLLIMAYVRFEQSYDKIHQHGERIYRVESLFFKGKEKTDHWPTSTNGYVSAMKANFAEIEDFTRINWNNSTRVVKYQNIKFREQHVCFADANFFTFFSYPVLKGDPATFLKSPNSVVISERAAKKYFGEENPMGKFLDIHSIGSSFHCMVTGVFADIPQNSTMQFDVLMSWETGPKWMWDFWYQHGSYSFVRLQPNTDIEQLEAKFPALAEQYKTAEALKDHTWAIDLVPLHDIHLNPAKSNEIEAKGNHKAIFFLAIISFVILAIGWVNYINLSTARAMDRSREIGIRKVVGSSRSLLIFQFLFESLLVNLMALVLAVLFVVLSIIILPRYINLQIPAEIWFDPGLYALFAVVFVTGTLLSGIYPALVLSQVKPILALKGKYTFSAAEGVLRKSLVVVQFAASLVLIIGTFVAYRQISFMLSQDLGVKINQVLVVEAPVSTENYEEKIESFKNELKASAGIVEVTGSGAIPGKEVGQFLANRTLHSQPKDARLYEMLQVDYSFIKTYDLELIAGRDFDKGRPSDKYGLILNESAVRQFGFESPQKAVGEKILLEVNKGRANEIIGVVKDYHQQSLQQKYTPIILFMDPDYKWIPVDFYSIKVQTQSVNALIEKVQQAWGRFFPESSFDYYFLDDFFNRQYQQDRQFGRTFMVFSSLAIIIACMGLFGLTSYNTARRTKEIGIRKVLGASVNSILSLLAWDTLKLILFSGMVAIPLSWYLVNQWLENYAFRIELSWWHGFVPLLILISIALATISYLSLKAALTNPSRSLRNE